MVFQHSSEPPHGFGDQERRFFPGIVQSGRMELIELHLIYHPLGAVYHGNSVSRTDDRVGGCGIHIARTTCCQQDFTGQQGKDDVLVNVEHIGPKALDIL